MYLLHSIIKKACFAFFLFTSGAPLLAEQSDEYLTDVYDKLDWSPMQEKFRQIAPMPFGVVFLPWAGCTEQDMRKHFHTRKQLGFTNLKQTRQNQF